MLNDLLAQQPGAVLLVQNGSSVMRPVTEQ